MAMVSTTFGRVPGTSVRLLHGRLVGEVHNLDFFWYCAHEGYTSLCLCLCTTNYRQHDFMVNVALSG